MKKIALLFAVAGLFLFSCSQQPKEVEQIIDTYTIAELYEKAAELDGQQVHFEGLVLHTCRHSGDKMHIVAEDNNELRVRVNLGEFAGQINPESEGKMISVIGKVSVLKEEKAHDCENAETTEEVVAEAEAEEEHVHDHDCDHDKELKEIQKKMVKFHIDLVSFEWI
ncbi:MAG: hypothetical protein KGZ97_06965 [Bacteroidetes bacterium]|nr:hypothetical protein [Bacteroidota bacterium]